jgi:hypothetical protein
MQLTPSSARSFASSPVEQRVEEALGPVGAEDLGDAGAHLALGRGIAGDEVLHVHPAAEPDAAQLHARAVVVGDGIAPDLESRKFRHHASCFRGADVITFGTCLPQG